MVLGNWSMLIKINMLGFLIKALGKVKASTSIVKALCSRECGLMIRKLRDS